MAASLGTAGTASFGQTGVATTAAAMTIESSGKVEKKKKKWAECCTASTLTSFILYIQSPNTVKKPL
jgi:hypothetical protein